MNRNTQHESYLRAHILRSRWYKVFIAAAAVVVFITTYMLILPAITLDTYCGEEEHTHTDACYTEEAVLTCSQAESAGHTHTDACYQTTEELICGQEESAPVTEEIVNEETGETETVIISEGHTHTADCYAQNTELICGQEESEGHTHDDSCYSKEKTLTCDREEHTHTEECYHEPSDPNADVENEDIWKQTFAHVELTGNWNEDVAAIAATQVGYKESTKNFVYDSDDEKDGYTRYGAWYGDTYGEWCAMFASFCVYYAEVGVDANNIAFPLDENCTGWINQLQQIGYYHDAGNTLYMDQLGRETYIGEDYFLEPGDLVFFNLENSPYVVSDHVGIVTDVTENKISTIQGNSNNSVVEKDYNVGDETIVGFGEIPENPAMVAEEEENNSAESESAGTAQSAEKNTSDSNSSKKSDSKSAADAKSDSDGKKKETAEVQYPSQSFQSSSEGMTVTVIAEEGAFPANTSMTVTEVTDEKVLEKAIYASGTENGQAKAVDITFTDAKGKEIEPQKAIRVTLKADEIAGTEDVTVVHVNDDNEASVVEQTPVRTLSEDEKPAVDEVIFDSDAFSTYAVVYTVDFSFGEYAYSIKGESSIYLSQLLEVLHIYKEDQSQLSGEDIREVTFSDETLLQINRTDEDWELISLQPFTTDEELKLTLTDGQVVVIDVTDDQSAGMSITGVKLKVNGTEYDLSNTSSVKIKNTDTLEFTLDYTIAPNTLSAEKNTIEYDLPEGLKVKSAVTNKNIWDGTTIVGTYSIDTDGHVTFVFNDDYVSKNSSGSQITADFSFEASVDESEVSEDRKIDIGFSDELKIDMEVEKAEEGDLTVRKQANHNTFSDGYIEYLVTVQSTAGTYKEITLQDVITTTGLPVTSISNFSIKKNGDDSTDITPRVNGTSGYSLTLPKLDADSYYTITYRVNYDKSQVPFTGTQIGNKITGESEASKGTKLTSSAEVITNVKPGNEDVVKKEAVSHDKDANTVSWKVTINSAGGNLNGWTLSDTLNRQPFTGTVTVDPAINGSNTITLPYTWENDDYKTYTITYTTTADKLPGQSATINKADLTKGGDNISSGDKGGGEWGLFDPLEKDATDITPNETYTEAIVDWKVTISANQSKIAAGWKYEDKLWNGQWFTGAQLRAIKSAIDSALSASGLSLTYTMKANLQEGTDGVGEEVSYEQINDTAKYKVYTLTFDSELQKGQTFTYTYRSTAPIDGVTENTTFRNEAYVQSGEKSFDDGQIIYVPPKDPEIDKTDNGANNDTSHDITSLDGTFDWDLKVTIPSDYGSKGGTTLTVVEHLPAGVTLEDLEILAQGTQATIFGATHWKNPNMGSNTLTIEGLGGPYQVELVLTERSDGGIDATVTIPENLVKYSGKATKDGQQVDNAMQEVRFVVEVKPTDSSDWTKDGDGYLYKKFGNTVELIDKDKKTISSDSQNQTITLKDSNKLVSKTASDPNDNVVTYSLKINEEEKDLVEGSDTIILKDIQKHAHNVYYEVDAAYVDGSFKVYYMNEGGSKGDQLKTDQYSFTYKETIDYENLLNNNPTAVNTITATLPDSKALIVEYQYVVSEPNGEFGRNTTLTNKAYLEGYTENRYSDETSKYVEVQKSSAHAHIDGVTLLKVDADNYDVKLSGVEFSLAKYDSASGTYVSTGKTYTTGTDGKINFTTDDIVYETAYKLVEEKGVSGYFTEKAPFYFIVTATTLKEGETANYIAPADFNGTIYNKGDTFYITNRKIPEKGLSVSKVWKDYEGNVIEDTTNMPEITARLKKNGEVIQTFTLSEENGWTEVFNNLDTDGQYTVEEATTLTGYQAAVIVYEQGDHDSASYISGGSYGSATITNQPSSPPPSGGETRVAVKKKWVDTDGRTVLTGDDLNGLEATVELVRYKAPQQGTTIHFLKNTDTSDTKKNEYFYPDVSVATQSSVTISFISSNWNQGGMYVLTGYPEYVTENNKGFWDYVNTNKIPTATATYSGTQQDGIQTYTFSTEGMSEIYLYCLEGTSNNFKLSEGITIASGSEAQYGDAELDHSYLGQSITLDSSNEWNAVFTGLPLEGTENGVTYAYTYAIKETNSSDLYELFSYSTGSDSVDSNNIPISKTGSNITVTNKKKEAYELPKTGGTGKLPYILSGLSLMIIALLLLFRRKSEEGRSIRKG
ncbi:MAG: CHAP domain-containing protein [Lachnospiraceae bacterium]|nr:CHAP domain-containing protein [Lachnospiraceae bacterium]